ncbi:MAG: hypothetical protein P8Y45_06550, partial [Exilibacterium sp.]
WMLAPRLNVQDLAGAFHYFDAQTDDARLVLRVLREAVAAGTAMAADLSRRLGWLSDGDLAAIRQLQVKAGLPIKAPATISTEQFLSLMAVDKKVLTGQLRLVLFKSIGEAVIEVVGNGGIDIEQLKACIDACRDL